MREEGLAYVRVYHATLLRRWVHIRDCGLEPSISLDPSVKSCGHRVRWVSCARVGRCSPARKPVLPTDDAGLTSCHSQRSGLKPTGEIRSRRTTMLDCLTSIVRIGFYWNLDDSKLMKRIQHTARSSTPCKTCLSTFLGS